MEAFVILTLDNPGHILCPRGIRLTQFRVNNKPAVIQEAQQCRSNSLTHTHKLIFSPLHVYMIKLLLATSGDIFYSSIPKREFLHIHQLKKIA